LLIFSIFRISSESGFNFAASKIFNRKVFINPKGEKIMKKLMFIAVAAMFSLGVMAQNPQQKPASTQAKPATQSQTQAPANSQPQTQSHSSTNTMHHSSGKHQKSGTKQASSSTPTQTKETKSQAPAPKK
jgi:hypothetical protein